MIVIPRRKFILSLIIPLVFYVAGLWSRVFVTMGIIADIVILAIGAIDIFSLLSERPLEIATEAERVFSINTENKIGFSVSNFSSSAWQFWLSLRRCEPSLQALSNSQ